MFAVLFALCGEASAQMSLPNERLPIASRPQLCPPQTITLPAQLVSYGDSVYFDLSEVTRARTRTAATAGSWTSLKADRKAQRYSRHLSAPDSTVARLGSKGEGLVEICIELSPVVGELAGLTLVSPSGKTLTLLKGRMRKPRTARQLCFTPLVQRSLAGISWIDKLEDRPIDWSTLAGETVAGDWTLVGHTEYGVAAPVQLSGWSLEFAAANVDRIRPLRDSLVVSAANLYATAPEGSGSYTFEVSDGAGYSRSYVFPVNVQSNCGFNVRLASSRDPSCPDAVDGGLSFVAIGAASPPLFTLGSTSNTSGQFANLAGGDYTLRVKGGDGCLLERRVSVEAPKRPRILFEEVAVSCVPAEYEVTVLSTGPTEVVSANWSSQGLTALSEAVKLGAGTHPLEYSDAKGCRYLDTLRLSPAEAIEVKVLAQAPACATDGNAQVQLVASGGVEPYDALWDDMASGLERKYLYPGTYSGFVYDQRGCETSFTTTILAPQPLLARHELLPPQCPGDHNGILSVTVSGGVAPYAMSIDGGSFVRALSIDTLSSGLHSFTIRDAGGCELSQVVTVPRRVMIPAEFDADASCAAGHRSSRSRSNDCVTAWGRMAAKF